MVTRMDKERRKQRVRTHSRAKQIIGSIGDLLGIIFLIGPGLTLILIECVGPSSPVHDPPIRELVPRGFIAVLGVILLIYGGLILCYYLAGPDE